MENINERFITEVVREFDFLRMLDYKVKSVLTYSREPGVIFSNNKKKREICISWEGNSQLIFSIRRKVLFAFSTKSTYIDSYVLSKVFDCKKMIEPFNEVNLSEIVQFNANFVKNELDEIINGNSWIKQ